MPPADAAARNGDRLKEQACDVICTLDGDNRFLQVSPRAGTLWGYAPDELAGRGCLDLMHADDRAAMAAMLQRARAGDAADGFEGRLVRKDGVAIPLLWSVMWSASHELAFAVARDLGHRLRAEDRLRRAQSWRRSASSPAASPTTSTTC